MYSTRLLDIMMARILSVYAFHCCAVKSGQMKWLPEGSEMPFNTKKKFTSFGSSQENLAGITSEGISCQYPDIIVAKLRPGQVWVGFPLLLFQLNLCFFS